MFFKIFTADAIHDIDDDIDADGLVRSRDRVRDQAEVFTAEREVNAMLDLIQKGPIHPSTTHLEPSCGSGNFTVEILRRKLAWIDANEKPAMRRAQMAIVAMASIYGIDISMRNIDDAKSRMSDIATPYLEPVGADWVELGDAVLSSNVVVGNFLKAMGGAAPGSKEYRAMKASDRRIFYVGALYDEDIRFVKISPVAEWSFELQCFSLRTRELSEARMYDCAGLNEVLRSLGEPWAVPVRAA